MDIQTVLAHASEKIGVKLEGLMIKEGRLKPGANKPSDVLGFDYIVRNENTCYEYYAANPPLSGMTQPLPVKCPLGIQPFDQYKIDYKHAIEIFQGGNWGSEFSSISLAKPLAPQVAEPYWNFMSNLGVNVVIGADSGEILHPK